PPEIRWKCAAGWVSSGEGTTRAVWAFLSRWSGRVRPAEPCLFPASRHVIRRGGGARRGGTMSVPTPGERSTDEPAPTRLVPAPSGSRAGPRRPAPPGAAAPRVRGGPAGAQGGDEPDAGRGRAARTTDRRPGTADPGPDEEAPGAAAGA